MSKVEYANDVLRKWHDDTTRTYHEYDEAGVETFSRDYNDEENEELDQALARFIQYAASQAIERQNSAILAAIAATSTAPPNGEEWVQPTGPADAYDINSTVTHAGKSWISLVAYNVWEPGVANWREQASDGYPIWVQPTGSSDAYNSGDRVSHNDTDWESEIDANVWEPGVYGWIGLGLF